MRTTSSWPASGFRSRGDLRLAGLDFDRVLEQYHQALDVFMRGNAELALAIFSHREDVTLGNPFGPVVRGFERVSETARLAASHMRDGQATGFDTIVKHVTPDFAYLVEVERLRTKIDGKEEIAPMPLRVTSIFLPEQGAWKLVHRHADPITSTRPWDSVIQK